jgi:hypothetical protein
MTIEARSLRVFVLSPASLRGRRAATWLDRAAERSRDFGTPTLAELMSRVSPLYFRGKYEYARRFARPAGGEPGIYVITATRGLWPAATRVTPAQTLALAAGTIDPEDPAYLRPLVRSGRRLLRRLGSDVQVVLLGSLATEKYLRPLQEIFGSRLCYPDALVGRGSLSRGALLLRAARQGRELSYTTWKFESRELKVKS